jgi:general secretion pathway protein G
MKAISAQPSAVGAGPRACPPKVHPDSEVGADSRWLKATNAFTLIEIMVVIVIIMILVGIVIGASKYAQTKAATSRAQAELAVMETALEHYKNDNGVYPRSTTLRSDAINNCTNLYAALVAGPGNPKTYMTFKPNQLRAISLTATNIIDPFGAPYNYYNNPGAVDQTNSASFDLWTYGPDNKNDTADDIVNWRQ